jgi:metal-sulfur cluster biosynthetic enzyme
LTGDIEERIISPKHRIADWEVNMLTQQTILEALQPVIDPEIGMSVIDLGMIREVLIEGDIVDIKMVLTTPFCPLAGLLTERVRQAAAAVPGVSEAKVTLLDEPWDPSWMKR